MIIKTIIVLLLIGNIIALGIAFVTLMQDQGGAGKRTANWLLVRVSLAILLVAAVAFGLWTGDLGMSAPWYGV
mgnify:CR=1|tara:strand:+ start:12781 stop:12999 length:219 start_codon:yes stop_codon:yes gene_type:complete